MPAYIYVTAEVNDVVIMNNNQQLYKITSRELIIHNHYFSWLPDHYHHKGRASACTYITYTADARTHHSHIHEISQEATKTFQNL
jgi:hypothetical protein